MVFRNVGSFGPDAFKMKSGSMALDATTMKMESYSVAAAKAGKDTAAFTAGNSKGAITLENFGRQFDNATRKVVMWQFAIMAVYGVIRKFGETIQVWKDFEVTLARISITTGATGKKLADYFREVADVAIEFGMPIEQTLTGMDLALRATAGSAQRTATAVQLLRDSSVLANITGMQYGQSIDILVGSLRQSGLELDKGQTLLDKWVVVAKNAAVSVNDLSQGFAIMADAGRAAGLTVDQINGLIAGLSETVTLGPVQVGNAIRALMSTLYNPGSISLLQKYGVAVRDTQGEVRSFWEVMSQLSAMKQADILDDSAWLEIAKAAGAGQRRYAQFLALLNNFSKAMQMAEISSTAEGQAMEANAKIVNTLTNTWDKYTASQRKFLFAFGEGTGAIGGLTDALQLLTNVFSGMADAGEGMWSLGKAVMYLVGTLGALKIASLAMGWMGVAPKVGSLLGRFGGVAASSVAGTSATTAAIAAAGITTPQAAAAAGFGVMAPSMAARRGLLGLSGLIPGATNRAARRVTELQGLQWRSGQWTTGQTAGPMGGTMVAPAPQLGGGGPITPMTWRGVGKGLSRGRGLGMGAGVAGVAAGAAAYGLTGEWQTAAGSGVASAIGFALAGPVGMVAGGLLGGFIGHAAADAFISQEERLKAMFEGISEDFGLDAEALMSKYYEVLAGGDEAAARRVSQLAAPQFSEVRAAEAQPIWARMFDPNVAEALSPLSIEGPQGKKAWETGLGALNELNQALVDGVITLEVYRSAKLDDRIAWEELSEAAKAYITVLSIVNSIGGIVTPQQRADATAYADAVREQALQTRELAQINNRYSDSQARIRDLMEESGAVIEGVTMKEWEQANVNKLLRDQINLTGEDFEKWYDVLNGSAYGYTAHVEAIERLKPLVESLGGALDAIPEEKWLDIQRFDPNFATAIGEATQTLSSMRGEIDAFAISFPDIMALTDVEGTIADIAKVRDALVELSTDPADKYADAILEIEQHYANLMQRDITARQLETQTEQAAVWRKESQVRLTDPDTIKAYRENLGRLGGFTDLAKSLDKTATSVLTLVDPLTGDQLRLDENTLALEMLGRVVQDNTSAQEKRLEAEYNLPGGYQRPNRYSALKTLGSNYGGFGEAQEGLWGNWMEFIRDRSMATGGTVPSTGPYYLHKSETVVSGDTMARTNSILGNSYSVLLLSQGYLSNISIGILGLRQEIQQLRQQLATRTSSDEGVTDFNRITKANYNPISSLGVRR